MSDIVKVLREHAGSVHMIPSLDLLSEAADEIDRLRALLLRVHAARNGLHWPEELDAELDATAEAALGGAEPSR